ncbi:hypothetical protein THMIRHAM_20540 [Thiomicrorhabdus immobilis]|uniref:diguanylate cyclase n=1 Tax=Thiomicrorhabdus immobilis TaxID=2791037 RepID=A0ABM7MFK5_9GAMM|nr:diguanylate cyclase [Thiomicrorhabdus immobilis]BCN94269.1 hypothetical protein THMIRHAM_20540 [Thiomicrorhabdus immobilis]
MYSNSEFRINKKPLYWLATALLFSYLIITASIYQQVKNTIIENKLNELNQHILYQTSLRQYINSQLKPIIYNLQKEHILSYDFFDPHLLSSTFISRKVYQIFDKKLDAKDLNSWKYRLAAKNPRNPVNQATPEEIELLEKFNSDRNLKQIHRVEMINSQETLYYAAPFNANEANCLMCHGDPKTAPKGLIEKYGSEHGFNEKLGDIRAFVSYRLNITESMLNANKTFLIISLIIFAFMAAFFALASWSYLIEQRRKGLIIQQQQELEYVAHHDFLTNLTNRHGLNRDLPVQLAKLNNEPVHLSNLWVIMLDIDFFKSINDDFGHDIGDLTLQKLGEILKTEKNNLEHAEAYRLGGEEFLIVIRNTDTKIIKALYKDICTSLAAIKIAGLNRIIKISAGATEAQPNEHQYELLKRVDQALYQAKEQGRARLIII